MGNSELQARLLASIGMTQASKELQDGFIDAFERMAKRRLGFYISVGFSAGEKDTVRRMRQAGMPDAEVMEWIKCQMGGWYDVLFEDVLMNLAQEAEMARAQR